jgi:diketogulonate reductase-like aldo/keto reductase
VEDRKDVEITGNFWRSEHVGIVLMINPSNDCAAKLFMLGSDGSQAHVTESLDLLYRLLGVSSIENFIVSAAHEDQVLPAWRTLEGLHKNGVIGRLGVTDFSETDLKTFSEKVQVQPALNQIELAQCCQLPSDLTSYAKANNIELLAHSDCSSKSGGIGNHFIKKLRN